MANDSEKDICYCISMRRAVGRVSEYYDRTLEPAGLTVNQFWLLGSISRLEQCSVVELAEEVKQDKSTLARTLKPLFRSEMIEDVSLKGSRNRQLRVAKNGLLALYRANLLWQDAQARIEKELGKENVELLLGMMSVLEKLESLPNTVATVHE